VNEQQYLCLSHSPLMQDAAEDARGPAFRAAVAAARERIAAFAPDLIVYFGTEHRRTLTDIVPGFTVALSARGYGDWNLSDDPYTVPAGVATALVDDLFAREIDVAFSPAARLDHGFGLTWKQLFPTAAAYPVIPVIVNCAIAPLSAPSRALAVGAAVGDFLRGLDARVLVLASGGLSHSPPAVNPETAKLPEAERQQSARGALAAAGELIDVAWDRRFLGAVKEADLAQLRALGTADIERAGAGTQEVRTWLAAIGAVPKRPSLTCYEPIPEWITGMALASSLA
jgi:2,3-dihydroxyphenylpropionate 1,2-dioxygenase